MKKLYILVTVIILSCKPAFVPCSIRYVTEHVLYEEALYITPLPFGPGMKKKEQLANTDAASFIALIGKDMDTQYPVYTPTYILPAAKNILYTAIEPEVDKAICEGQDPDNLFTTPKYKLRLPDHNGLQVYYMTNDAVNHQGNADELREHCSGYAYNYYGNLVVYNPATKTANTSTIFQSKFSDWPHDRLFFIDKDYTIYIADFTPDDGDEGSPAYHGPSFKVTISGSGQFVINKLK